METISDRTDRATPRLKTRVGRLMARVALVAAGTATAFLGVNVGEAVVGTESQAAASPLDSMNGAEKSWCAWPSRWNLCSRTQQLSSEALSGSQDVASTYGRQLHNGDADAFRHCYWSARMTQEFGWETAKGFGDRHEYNETQPPLEEAADLYNNRQGRIWAQENANVWKRCLDGMLQGELSLVVPYAR